MDDSKLTLAEHLQELRSRLWKVVIAVLVLGGGSLAFAREIFGLLMRPVLAALPEESRSLVYTSGIEEINVLLKVGLYAGIFLSAPVALYQLWLFVAPGLLKSERRLIGPFVSLGTLFFVGGAVFCYLAVLPTMFQFLLSPGETGPVRQRIAAARGLADDAGRLLLLGEGTKAMELAQAADQALGQSGDGAVGAPEAKEDGRTEVGDRLARLGRMLDGLAARPLAEPERAAAARAVSLRHEADALFSLGDAEGASAKLEEAALAMSQAFSGQQQAATAVWSAHKRLAKATGKLGSEEWTRPMLSMREQLSLVLMLEVAFGAIFELPLLMALLAMMGILRFAFVAKYQRHAVLLCVAAAAIVSPTGDAVNLALMALPMLFCFELGVGLVWIFERRRAAKASGDGDGEDAPAEAA